MSYLATFTKDPNAKLDYSVDWSTWLPTGDTISTAAWTVAGPDASLVVAGSPAPSHASGVATVWLEGGTAGNNYRATCRITTADGRVDDRTIELQVRER